MKAIIEMKEGDFYKYELDKQTNRLVIDRVLNLPVPCGYGFIPGTLSEDGDPLDVFVYSDQVIERGCEAPIKIIGGFSCEDSGLKDDKLVAVLKGEHLDSDLINEIMGKVRTYLSTYKKSFKILSAVGPEGADLIYTQSRLVGDRLLHMFAEKLENDDTT